jgi:hypothetical protein
MNKGDKIGKEGCYRLLESFTDLQMDAPIPLGEADGVDASESYEEKERRIN